MTIGTFVSEAPVCGMLTIWGHTKNTIANEIHRVYHAENTKENPVPEYIKSEVIDSIWGENDGLHISFVTERFLCSDFE